MIKKRKKIDFKDNFIVYLGFLKKYKAVMFLILLVVLVNEAAFLSEKFLFKVVIDDGTRFTNGLISSSEFISILTIVGIIFVGALSSAVLTNWLKLHLVNRIEVKMIADLKRKFFNYYQKQPLVRDGDLFMSM